MDIRKSSTQKAGKIHRNGDISSTSLRRKSIVQILLTNILSENDDEAKCIAHEIFTTSTSQSISNNQRYSQGLERSLTNIPIQIAENINQCIKLSAENKINIKNAFNLEMIDFMMYMIKKQDANISNLQVASISLDVSTKIYGYRVDNVYTEILKMVDGLAKQITDNMKQNSEEREETVQKDAKASIVKKKKKKAIKKILSTVEALRDKIEIAKPILTMTGERDVQTSDMLYQATLPNHANSGFYQHLYNDVFVDVLEDTFKLRSNSNVKYAIPAIEDFSNLEICASYSNFEFLGWSVENEPEEMPEEETECNDDSGNRFDLDASMEHDDDPMLESMDFDIDNDENNVQAYYQANVKDTSMHNDEESEYSFQPSMSLHWADSSYWKFWNSARFSAVTEVDTNMVCLQSNLRKRKQFELSYDDTSDIVDAKFASSQCNKLQARTIKAEWSAKNLTLPEDVHYDIAQMNKFYLYQRAVEPVNSEEKEDKNMVIASDDGERYDCNNPIDTQEHRPNVEYDIDYRSRDSNFDNVAVLDSQVLISDNQAAMPKINKISIAKPKKIDMQELKKSIWNCLKSRDNKAANTGETVDEIESMKESKKFSDVYKMLPKLLTKSNAEALSVPISFVSMLHLANEKALEIRSEQNMSDIIIEPRESLLN